MQALSTFGCSGRIIVARPPSPSKQKWVTTIFSSHHNLTVSPTRRTLPLSLLLWALPATATLSFPLPPTLISTIIPQQQHLERYSDDKEGFTLLVPSAWMKVDKAGATVLFEEMNGRGNSIGVVVNPVRLSSLGDFGTPQFVANKLIQAEKRKESTKDAELIGYTERSGAGGLQVYEFEYKVDSTRGGIKRIFSAAFVAARKLYLLNIVYSDRPENPIDAQTRAVLEKIVHSFDMASSSI